MPPVAGPTEGTAGQPQHSCCSLYYSRLVGRHNITYRCSLAPPGCPTAGVRAATSIDGVCVGMPASVFTHPHPPHTNPTSVTTACGMPFNPPSSKRGTHHALKHNPHKHNRSSPTHAMRHALTHNLQGRSSPTPCAMPSESFPRPRLPISAAPPERTLHP